MYEELVTFVIVEDVINDLYWLKTKGIENRKRYHLLLQKLDPGEAEAIVLAQELNADLLLIDERKGRQIAKESGLRITGLIGVLLESKRRGEIEKVKPLIRKLREQLGFRISESLYNKTLKLAGEE
ncbi:MAG: DUF3368 domain-containing protein [Bacteroidota bacterium]